MYSKPWRAYLSIAITIIICVFIAMILFPQLKDGFTSNPGLNGLIFAFLISGLVHSFWVLSRIGRGAGWLSQLEDGVDFGDLHRQKIPRELRPLLILMSATSEKPSLAASDQRVIVEMISRNLADLRRWGRVCTKLLMLLGGFGAMWSLMSLFAATDMSIGEIEIGREPASLSVETTKNLLIIVSSGFRAAFASIFFGLAAALILGLVHYRVSRAQNQHLSEIEQGVFDFGATGANLDKYGAFILNQPNASADPSDTNADDKKLKTAAKSFWFASLLSLVWLSVCTIYLWGFRSPEIAQGKSLSQIIGAPEIAIMLILTVLPIGMVFAITYMLWRAQQMKRLTEKLGQAATDALNKKIVPDS